LPKRPVALTKSFVSWQEGPEGEWGQLGFYVVVVVVQKSGEEERKLDLAYRSSRGARESLMRSRLRIGCSSYSCLYRRRERSRYLIGHC
jgi:hypothetical protein